MLFCLRHAAYAIFLHPSATCLATVVASLRTRRNDVRFGLGFVSCFAAPSHASAHHRPFCHRPVGFADHSLRWGQWDAPDFVRSVLIGASCNALRRSFYVMSRRCGSEAGFVTLAFISVANLVRPGQRRPVYFVFHQRRV